MCKYLVATLIMLSVNASRADSIDTEMLLQASVDCFDCIDWKPVGVCIWMTCTPWGCDFDYSIRFKNFVPDFVVTSYSNEETPFEEMQSVVDSSNEMFGFAAGFATTQSKHVDHLRFKKTEVWGNPGVAIFEQMHDAFDGMFCKSGITTYKPYYIWTADYIGWHMNIPDMFNPKSYTGAHDMGTTTVKFGNVYPRCGWSIHPEDPKAAALSAQRAGYIVTNPNDNTRVRLEPETDCGDKCWPAEEIIENDMTTHKWQMLVPKYQTKGEIFGTRSGWSNFKYDTDEQYAWLLWRPYSCCSREGAVLIFSIDLTEGEASSFDDEDFDDLMETDGADFGSSGSGSMM
ncbi:TIGR03756 family integrating conjugative element protein [Gilvimarinus chinensis]|uniref:TIGR03756 family integrating conjugative element protein n=1 Tax=Gilvimarinus TaxID=940550 RepID=UPI0003A2F622|nr:TIGR03756 family integrating conjugative element protein [Gilvimarinus chinensis]